MSSPRLLSAALGAGFYRNWHVPSPRARVGLRETTRADLSVIAPGALGLLALGFWVAGRVGTAVMLDSRLSTPFAALPWTSRLLLLSGLATSLLAVAWWACTAVVRIRVAAAIAEGEVARIPDHPADAADRLHPAVTALGRALRDAEDSSPLADPAYRVLRTATAALHQHRPDAEQRRLRRRCLAMAHRLSGTGSREAGASVTQESVPSAAGRS